LGSPLRPSEPGKRQDVTPWSGPFASTFHDPALEAQGKVTEPVSGASAQGAAMLF